MRRGGLLIVLGLILAIGAAVIILMTMMQQQPPPPPPPPGAPEAQPTGVPTQKVWVALQPIKRGGEFVEGTLGLRDWPTTNVPPDVIGDAAETIGRVAATDIVQGMPILRSMLAEKGAAGQAALQVPPGRVAVAFPIDEQSSVAYAIQPGDYVDVLIMASFIDLDPEFQTKRPNYVQFFTSRVDKETGETSFNLMERTEEGRFERPPGLPPEISGAIVYPREEQRPRRVAQLTVQAAKVLRVGPWIEVPTPTPPGGATGEGAQPQPPPPPRIITLAVDPQDALVLLWARKSEMHMELALRASGDENARHQPEAVTLQYMLARFQISVPPKLEYGFEREAYMQPAQPIATPQPMGQ
ncbi:MAG: Flp pilus assembly protein CpaB [Ardenticatenia bacterium]|jgi:pilus assembly protein CpaB|nr:MAG: Flp pilus assembly protein CpaB [Ardenticatenia bacterium]